MSRELWDLSFGVISAYLGWARVPGGAVCWADPSFDWCSISFSGWAGLSERNGADILIIGNSLMHVSEQIEDSGRLKKSCA